MYLFVYGTLKRGYGNNRLLWNSDFLGEGFTIEKFALHQHGFPVASKNGDMDKLPILGEVYKVSARDLVSCDMLEGHPSWYRREPVNVKLINTLADTTVEANIYLQKQGNNKPCSINNNMYYWAR